MATLAAYGKNKDKRRDVTKTDMPFGGTYKHVTIKDKAGNIKKTKIKRKYPDGAKSKKVIKGDKWKKVDRDGLKRTVTRGKITNDGGRKKLPEPDVKPIRPWEPKIMR